jgi:two-component system chemotaxis response regulator CheB
MAIRPLPVVVCSITHESGVAALEALEAGAVEFVQKPTALATDRVYEIADELIAKVKAAASVSLAHVVPQSTPQPLKPSSAKTPKPSSAKGRVEIVVIGISTGGPQALRFMIPQLPADFPVPIAMVLHMPIGYTEMYARRLDEIAALHVVEAVEGELVRPGRAFLAPAGRHLTFARESDGSVRTRLDLAPGDTPHRPAADVLFRSAAAIFGSQVLGVVMTGMGTDGLAGAMAIKAAGGRILTEAESSCVVYGMPRAVAEARLSDRVATLEEMSTSIADMV